MFLSTDTFKQIIDKTPLISIDLIVKNHQGNVLLGKRTNAPAKNYWFVPGGRIQKNESLNSAFARLCQEELGIQANRSDARLLGPYEHFYNDSVFSDDISTHYVVLGYELTVDIELANLPAAQHAQYQWFSLDTLLASDFVHPHTKWYFTIS